MMTFEKPSDVSYTDMCIYIDQNIYNNTYDTELVYKYLYFIIHMLATKQQILKPKYIDSFALFGATKIYFRLTNKDQFVKTSDLEYKLKRVKSVLNYIKSSLYFLKVDFEQSEYYQEFTAESQYRDEQFNFDNVIDSAIDHISLVEFESTLNDVDKTCKMFLSKLPIPQDSVMWHRVYMSVILTFTNSLTLSYKQQKRIKELTLTGNVKNYHYNNYYELEGSKPILYQLPEDMGPYIIVLTRQLKHILRKDLSEICHTKINHELFTLEQYANELIKDTQENLDED